MAQASGRKEIAETAAGAFLGALAAGLATLFVDFLRERTLKDPNKGASSGTLPGGVLVPAPTKLCFARQSDDEDGEEEDGAAAPEPSREWL